MRPGRGRPAGHLSQSHLPVLRDCAATLVAPRPGQTYIDVPAGQFGHTLALLALEPTARILTWELDPLARGRAAERLGAYLPQVTIFAESFVHLEERVTALGLARQIAGAIVDPGMSWEQATGQSPGFSFSVDSPLTMTFDPDADFTAADYLRVTPVAELVRNFLDNGIAPKDAQRVAEAIVLRRRTAPLTTTFEFRQLITDSLGRSREGKRDASTRYFQAVRVAVTHELEDLAQMLPGLLRVMQDGATGVVLMYQGNESSIVKTFFKTHRQRRTTPSGAAALQVVTPRAIRPSPDERRRNPASRSALLRAFRRVTGPLVPEQSA